MSMLMDHEFKTPRNNFNLQLRRFRTTPEVQKDVLMKDRLEIQLQNSFPNYGFKCFSFEGNDWECNSVTVVLADRTPRSIVITAPEESIEKAVKLVMEMNPDLSFTKGRSGHADHDFVYNRFSMELIIN